jgi:O-antigen/teichoic acid export membrane protein
MKNSNAKNNEKKEDLLGKDRVIINVLTSWGSHLVLVVIGFILPRLINDRLGQVSLGIWDLSWSFVNYLSLAGYGVGSSVNRYVAKYRAVGDSVSLNSSLSSVVFIQLVICLVVIAATAILVWLLPGFVGDREGVDIRVVSWVVALLGLSLAAQMAFDTSRGLLTGMHRWDLYNGLNAATHILSAIFMIVALLMDGGLISLAFVYFSITLIMEITRSIIATRLCKELDLKRELINLSDITKMFKYGAKSMIASSPAMITIQTLNIFIAGTLGPAALALFARPLALVRHVETFLNKFSFVLTPMVGSIGARGRSEELQDFLIESTKYSVAFTLPIIIFLSLLGDVVLEVWMGKDYANLNIILALCLGYFLRISQAPALRVLMGMNAHGKLALFNLFLTAIVLLSGLGIITMLGWKLIYVAILSGVIFTLTSGLATPIFACRAVKVNYFQYLIRSFRLPIILNLVLLPWLYFMREIDGLSPATKLIGALFVEMILMSSLYWVFLVPESIKRKSYSKIPYLKNKSSGQT